MALCTECGREIRRGRWCSDRCRKANARRTAKVGQKAGHLEVGQISTCPGFGFPEDPVILANSEIGWSDILAMPRVRIDEAYWVHRAVGGDVLLRLRRAAGYFRRVA